jgi:hypothetical protein
MSRRLVLTAFGLSAALALLAACDRKPEPQQQAAAPAAPPSAPAKPAGPLTFEKKAEHAEVSLKLPEAVGRVPALYSKLYSEGVNDLEAFFDGSKGEHAELVAAGAPAVPFARELDWKLGAETPRLIGLKLEEYENTGGAHPNASLGALIWDKQQGKVLAPTDLLRAGADPRALDKLVCDAVHAAKQERTGSPALMEGTKCPSFAEAKLSLLPSTAPGKAGGLEVLISPYEIGPWVEGSYEVELPADKLAGELSPAYAGEFGGAPKPDVKPKS